MYYLGIDTSNYSTSLAVFDGETGRVVTKYKKILDVELGKTGLRQSDAVFLHTKNLPFAVKSIENDFDIRNIDAVGVSARPRDIDGSYMPCFLSGLSLAHTIGDILKKDVIEFSHQAGHVMAALYGTGFYRENKKSFFAFHISGGTTDALECSLDEKSLSVKTVATSLDIFAGQAVDRVGNMLSLQFPSGEELSNIAEDSDCSDYMKPVLKENDCCLSGLENKCKKLFEDTGDRARTARYCLLSVAETVLAMERKLVADEDRDVVYAGGVMSSKIIREYILNKRSNAFFCEPAYLSADNAVGTAILAYRAKEL